MSLTNAAVTRLSKFVAKHKDQIPGGLGDEAETTDFSDEQVTKGIKVEMEHTDDQDIAREIALDHLVEDPRYYDYLEDMEHTMKSAAEYKGEQDPYEPDVVKRQDDWARMHGDETNLENWKHLDNNKVTDYKRGQAIDPVDQMFDYVLGMLDVMRKDHKESPDGFRTQEYANALEQVMDILDPFM